MKWEAEIKKMGPNIEPWGTPQLSGDKGDEYSPKLTERNSYLMLLCHRTYRKTLKSKTSNLFLSENVKNVATIYNTMSTVLKVPILKCSVFHKTRREHGEGKQTDGKTAQQGRRDQVWQIWLNPSKAFTFNTHTQFKMWEKNALIYSVKCHSQAQTMRTAELPLSTVKSWSLKT